MSSLQKRPINKVIQRSRRSLIYFSSVPFDSYAQRPHFMVEAFSQSGFDAILWVDPYPTRLPKFSDIQRFWQKKSPVINDSVAHIELLKPSAVPIEPLPMSSVINHAFLWRHTRERLQRFAAAAEHCVIGVGRPSQLAEWALERLPHTHSFIDVLDNFPEFYSGVSRLAMQRRMTAICARVDDVYCSSTALKKYIQPLRPDALTVLNGYFSSEIPEPSPYSKRKYIGYVGSIAKWFDWPLVISIAKALPNNTIRLIGPEFIPRPSGLPRNIEFIGEVPHTQVAEFIQEFIVGLIPFRIDKLTAAVDPIKYYEYRCFGIPVWSTNFGEMQYREDSNSVMHIDSNTDWNALLNTTLSSPAPVTDLENFKNEISWNNRFKPVIERSLRPSNRLNNSTSALEPDRDSL